VSPPRETLPFATHFTCAGGAADSGGEAGDGVLWNAACASLAGGGAGTGAAVCGPPHPARAIVMQNPEERVITFRFVADPGAPKPQDLEKVPAQ
jgi:hypothetical protein